MSAESTRELDLFLEKLRKLKLDRANGAIKPYKPVLLLSVFVLIATRKIRSRFVMFDGGLKSLFGQLFARVRPDWSTRPDVRYPFRALENDRVWQLVPFDTAAEELDSARAVGMKTRDVMKHVECAQLDEPVFRALSEDATFVHRAIAVLLESYPECVPPHTGTEVLRLLAGAALSAPAGPENLSERAIEEHIERHWGETPFAKLGVNLSTVKATGLPGRQVITPAGTIDLLGFDPSARTWWVLELKKGRAADPVVGQVSRYMGWVVDERRSHGEGATGAIIARDADDKLRYAVKGHRDLSLWTFDDDLALTRAG